MKKSIYIIVFFVLILLTGCDINTKSENDIEKQHDTLVKEQIELLDTKMFATLENVLGIHFMNYRLVTLQQQATQENDNNQGSEQESSGGDQEKEEKENRNIEIMTVVDDNTVFKNKNEPDWDKSQQYVRQVSDIFIDVQIELSKRNVAKEKINEYGSYFADLVLDISNKERNKAIKDIEILYSNAYIITSQLINDEKILAIKKVYYDLIQLLLQLEQKQERKFNELLEGIKENINSMESSGIYDNNEYIVDRIKMLADNIDYKKSNDAKLKIVMLVNAISVLEYSISEKQFDKSE